MRQNQPQYNGPAYQPLVVVLVGASAGILADRFRPIPLLVWWTITGIALVAWLVLWRRGWLATAGAVLLLAAAAVAGAWHHCHWHLFAADDLGHFARSAGQPVCIEAIALKTPRPVPPPEPNPMRATQRGDQVRFEVELIAIRDGAQWRPASGRARVNVQALMPGVLAGDRLQIFGQLVAPPQPRNPGEFDAASFLRAKRVRSQLRVEFAESVSPIAAGPAWSPRSLLERVRMHGNRLFQKYLDPQRSGLAAAVLLGAREQLEPERTEAFVETGTVHLLVIAGLHMGILVGAVFWAMRRAPIARGWVLLIVSLFTVFYAAVVDAEPPVLRAAVLMLCTCAAAFMGRQRLGFNALAAAALLVLAFNPADLFHVGAQLSFLCVAGLVWFAPLWLRSDLPQDPLDRLIAENRGWGSRVLRFVGRYFWRLTTVSLVIWLLTAPLVMARFHLSNPVAIVLNPLVWLPMAVALIAGFSVLTLGTVFPPLAPVAGSVCNSTLALLEWMVHAGRRVPHGHAWVPGPDDWWLAGFYGGLAVLAAVPFLRPPRRWCVGLAAAWISIGFLAAALRVEHNRLSCSFLSVGHGCAAVVQLPTGQTILYDAGQMDAPVAATRSISGFLWSRGITHIDAVVLSHGDADHYNALPGLLERFSVGVIYVSPVMFDNENPAMLALREAISRSGVPVREIVAGDQLVAGRAAPLRELTVGEQPEEGLACALKILNPPPGVVLGSENSNSIVLSVEYRGRRILLTGDLESPGLDCVVADPLSHCDLFLIPHHGSRQSDPQALAGWSTPDWAIISGTRRWDPRPVEAVYRKTGSQV
jgi:competence protein ComEC